MYNNGKIDQLNFVKEIKKTLIFLCYKINQSAGGPQAMNTHTWDTQVTVIKAIVKRIENCRKNKKGEKMSLKLLSLQSLFCPDPAL